MKISIKSGDIVDEAVDILVSTANPWLTMSGGVNGELLHRGGESIQVELEDYLKKAETKCVPQGAIIETSGGPFQYKCILHVVGIDAFYHSSIEVIEKLLLECIEIASLKGVGRIAVPAIATGYGHLRMVDFAQAVKNVEKQKHSSSMEIVLVLRDDFTVQKVKQILEPVGI